MPASVIRVFYRVGVRLDEGMPCMWHGGTLRTWVSQVCWWSSQLHMLTGERDRRCWEVDLDS